MRLRSWEVLQLDEPCVRDTDQNFFCKQCNKSTAPFATIETTSDVSAHRHYRAFSQDLTKVPTPLSYYFLVAPLSSFDARALRPCNLGPP
jgi:hypothetical protein